MVRVVVLVRVAVAGLSAAGRAGVAAAFGTSGRFSVAVCRRRKHRVSWGKLQRTHHDRTETFYPKICYRCSKNSLTCSDVVRS